MKLFVDGDFGVAVAERLAGSTDVALLDSHNHLEAIAAGGSLVVVLLPWERRHLLLAADAIAHDARTPWIPIVGSATRIRIGPNIVPGESACMLCYVARMAQQALEDPVVLQILAAFDRGAQGPAGWLPAQAAMTAELVQALARGDAALAPGDVVELSLDRLHIARHTVIGVHGCPRCDVEVRPSAPFLESVRQSIVGSEPT